MRHRIFITEVDYAELRRLIAGRRAMAADTEHLNELEQELERADILEEGDPYPQTP